MIKNYETSITGMATFTRDLSAIAKTQKEIVDKKDEDKETRNKEKEKIRNERLLNTIFFKKKAILIGR